MTFYNLRTNPPGDLPYQIIKFSDDLNPESVYNLGSTICECPAGHQPRCRHRTMLAKLIERVDTAWFLCFETMEWEDPTGNAAEHDEVAEHDEATGGLETNPIEQPVVEGTEVDGNQEAQPQYLEGLSQTVTHTIIYPIAGEGPGPSTLATKSWRRF